MYVSFLEGAPLGAGPFSLEPLSPVDGSWPRILGLTRGSSLALIGGGGKTSLLFYFAEALARMGLLVFSGTSTKMKLEKHFLTTPESAERALLEAASQLHQQPDGCGCLITAGEPDEARRKLAAFDPEFMKKLHALADCSVLEADGSKGLPLKMPASYEPVLYPFTTHILLVTGLSALGRPLGEVLHRPELFAAGPLTQRVTPALIAEVLNAGYLKRYAADPRLSLCFNQCDGPREEAALAELLPLLKILPSTPVFASSFRRSVLK